MEGIAVEYFPTFVDTDNNEGKYEYHSYISGNNDQDAYNLHAHMVHLFFKESVILVSGMSVVWEDTAGCAKQYVCALSKYLITLLSCSYGIIVDRAINAPGHRNNVVDGLNATYRGYLKD